MADNILDSKKIAKNTIMLYFRMFFMMAISLYTSRIVLHALGASDIGIQNVVGSVIGMISFINSTLSGATQRFITIAIGEGNSEKIYNTFSTAFVLHIFLAIIVFIAMEVLGLLTLYNATNIPENRMTAAFWVMQFAIISTSISITQVPYMSFIVAKEKMGIFAYLSIMDGIIKFLIAIIIYKYAGDRLILYSLLLLIASVLMVIIYRAYCIRSFKECCYKKITDHSLFKKMLIFSGWDTVGCLACTLSSSGISLLFNNFFGVIINAAIQYSNTISTIVLNFVNNFQTATNPQIFKLYSIGERDKMFSLVKNASKFSAYIMLFFLVPLFIKIDFVYYLWLGNETPEHTAQFAQIFLIQNLIRAVSSPFVKAQHATGQMKYPNIFSGSVLLLILPMSYILLKIGFSPLQVLIFNLLPWLCELLFDLYFTHKCIGFSVSSIVKDVYLRVLAISILGFIPPLLINQLFPNGWLSLIMVTMTSSVWLIIVIYTIGLNKHLRALVLEKVVMYYKRIFNSRS
jgi:Na+-driven multidrug efflux pump